ncbi:excisionase family DNA-binding protein [Duganella sp. FT50W]|uniref:Excisionase family DNA-binding protein n=1 Tax=Duganella lactea TaxID=2692173 RepID=A0A6L8MH14_9BURK|nr:helix-turn-helix domain-containing protein [Duganella lactea]MYM81804.1 excisionase family DNA-binding protein [Duganella lactea]
MMEDLTTEETAKFLSLSRSHVNSLVDANALPAIRTSGGHRRVPKAALVEYKQNMKARQAMGLDAMAEASSAMGLYDGELDGIPSRHKRKV